MKKTRIYRIVKHTYHEKCLVKNEHYTIEYKNKFLGFTFWKPVTEVIQGPMDSYNDSIKFTTELSAINAIKNLHDGAIPDGWTEKVINVLDFSKV